MEYRTKTPAETETVGETLAATLCPGAVVAFTWGRGRPPLSGDWPGAWGSVSG